MVLLHIFTGLRRLPQAPPIVIPPKAGISHLPQTFRMKRDPRVRGDDNESSAHVRQVVTRVMIALCALDYGGVIFPSTQGWLAPVACGTFDGVPQTVSFPRIANATASRASAGMP